MRGFIVIIIVGVTCEQRPHSTTGPSPFLVSGKGRSQEGKRLK
ncbi:hypothetical protein, unlikely [Trypanosoma brucei brucei TREU927]|uniref:Uncharacterized protein n=1 Tax=Trypanosoma brucei brucei (strain 927/4 GUTat10.1) TaxID=185431 RepID=Q4GZ18_TRYB2|nr:hypothetical protein, unlikely [Trypanosoma brucei brucei TREU927]CAJ16263.1 hypothetical protein, unlikely [Trypanosoma brucei brucei TREU927]